MCIGNCAFVDAKKSSNELGYVAAPTFAQAPRVGFQPTEYSFIITQSSKYKDDDFKVICYLLSDEVQAALSKQGIISPLTSKSIQQLYASDVPEEKGKNVSSIYSNSYPTPPHIDSLTYVVNPVATAFTDMVTKGQDVNSTKSNMGTTANATMDFAIAKEVLMHLIEGAGIANQYTDEVEKWQEMLRRIPPYQINEDGAVREWMHPHFQENYHHRHMSHTYPIFPGDEVTREECPELFEAFVTAAKKRLVIGLKEQTSWSLAYMSNLYARNGEGDLALECLDSISRSCLINNFYTFHNDWRNMGIGVDMNWAPFQIDANMGWSAAMQEMLLSSTPGAIRILPALPSRWIKGHAGPLVACGGIEVSLSWNQETSSLTVELLSRSHTQIVKLVLPSSVDSPTSEEIELVSGHSVRLDYTFS